jgi:hypothetical protein
MKPIGRSGSKPEEKTWSVFSTISLQNPERQSLALTAECRAEMCDIVIETQIFRATKKDAHEQTEWWRTEDRVYQLT